MKKILVILLAVSVLLALSIPALALELDWKSKNATATSSTGVNTINTNQATSGNAAALGNAAMTTNNNFSLAEACGLSAACNSTTNLVGNGGLAGAVSGDVGVGQGAINDVTACSGALADGADGGDHHCNHCGHSREQCESHHCNCCCPEINIYSKNAVAESSTNVCASNSNSAGSGNAISVGNLAMTNNNNCSIATAGHKGLASNDTTNCTMNYGEGVAVSGNVGGVQVASNTVCATSVAGAYAK